MVLPDNKVWLSVCIYFYGSIYDVVADRIIVDTLNPIIEHANRHNWYNKFFFIRYTDNKSHIRLRFLGDKETIQKELKTFINNYCLSNKLSFKWSVYEQEIERYGGKQAIEVAEDFFYTSSIIAIKLVKSFSQHKVSKNLRLGKGLICMLIFIHIFIEDMKVAANFTKHYSNGYINLLVSNQSNLKDDIKTSFEYGLKNQDENMIKSIGYIWVNFSQIIQNNEIFAEYKQELEKLKMKLGNLIFNKKIYKNGMTIKNYTDFIYNIGSSYIHMMNNRLGISIKEEAYLTFLIHNSLRFKGKINE